MIVKKLYDFLFETEGCGISDTQDLQQNDGLKFEFYNLL